MGVFDKFRKKEVQEEVQKPHCTEKLGYPFRLLPSDITDSELMEVYRVAAERGKQEGFTPVLVPDDDILDEYFDILHDGDYHIPEVLAAMEKLDGKSILQERLQMTEEEWRQSKEFRGCLTGQPGIQRISLSESTEKKSRIALVEVPTAQPWEAVVYVPFGGWNDCPVPEEMAAILKYWYEEWGAVPAVITHDELQMVLPRPIPEEAIWDVAEEQYAFTVDCVDQGTETLGALASLLLRSVVWYFWWD